MSVTSETNVAASESNTVVHRNDRSSPLTEVTERTIVGGGHLAEPDVLTMARWATARAAYEALDAAARADIADLNAHHSRRHSMERAGLQISEDDPDAVPLYGFHDIEPPLRPIVKVHPDTGRPNLVVGQHAFGVDGLSADDSGALLDRLDEHATASPHTYHHDWTVGDALLWDNRRLMHRATPHDPAAPRRMWHTRIAGDPATETAFNYLDPA